jgi:tripartite-type tricarboxylate transporter receptor subunit TctC
MLKRIIAFVSCIGCAAANAQAPWPNKPVRAVVPFAPGGGTDVMARILVPKLAEEFGQQFVIDNRTGAGGAIGNEIVVRAAPDGYTILIGASSYASNAALYKLPYDPIKGFYAVTLLARGPFIVGIHPGVKAANLKEFLDVARARPGSLTFGSSGTGSVPHLAAELFLQLAKLNMVHAPYKGDAPAITDLLGGHIQLYFGGALVMASHINAGKLRGLAVTTEKRSAVISDLPALSEMVPGYSSTTWFGVWVPLNTPHAIVNRLNQGIGRTLKLPDVQERLRANAYEPGHNTPAEFNRFIEEEIAKYIQVVKNGNIKVQ